MEKKRGVPINIRVNYPFIYFLTEENIVLVYQIRAEEYVTGTDLIESGNMETYDVASPEDFESFIHTDSKPVEGRSIFMNHRDLDRIADEVNGQIQKIRQPKKAENQANTVHLVTSESAAGSLRVGLAQPKTVIGFPDAFSIGPLWRLPEKAGLDFRIEWLFNNINFEEETAEYERKIKNALLQIDDIEPAVPIYIWYGNNAEEQTALRFYLWLLRDKTNDICLMNTTELYEKYIAAEDGSAYFHTGLLDSKMLKQFFENEKKNLPLSEEEKIHFHREWAVLSETEEVLRIWRNGQIQNGQIQTVSESHFDSLIIAKLEERHQKQTSKDFILVAQLIGEIVAGLDELVHHFYLEYRVRELLYNGTLEIRGVPKSMRHYGVKLRNHINNL
ncbi:DUF1835 domain-containing protein [Metaplanococcus flavidus]|uniref:DUF1835 domain-containing protein n=2 Tax=Metaplanococcus flavidus TaxID=569883 RepID=A0ABW3LD59_9BACL